MCGTETCVVLSTWSLLRAVNTSTSISQGIARQELKRRIACQFDGSSMPVRNSKYVFYSGHVGAFRSTPEVRLSQVRLGAATADVLVLAEHLRGEDKGKFHL